MFTRWKTITYISEGDAGTESRHGRKKIGLDIAGTVF